MKTTLTNKVLSFLLCTVLIAAMALGLSSCGSKTQKTEAPAKSRSTAAETVEATKIGEGSKQFEFTVVDANQNETLFIVSTDKKTVGEALLDAGLIEGDKGEYGLYVKKVTGIEADYDKDNTYWAFYDNGTLASAGVDMTDITEGHTYMFKVEK